MSTLKSVIVIAAFACSVSAFAAAEKESTGHLLSDAYAVCEASVGVAPNANVFDCLETEGIAKTAKLNDTYNALVRNAEPARKAQLVKSQALWTQYTDANCGLADVTTYGSMPKVADWESVAPVQKATCKVTATANRINELNVAFLQDVTQ